eukprot:scaffold123385_cov18-Tisochrysis_lutea.AAC.1
MVSPKAIVPYHQSDLLVRDAQIKDWIQPTSSPTLPGSFFPARRPFPGERQPREGQQQMQQLLPKDGHGDGGASLTSKTVASVMAALNAWQ